VTERPLLADRYRLLERLGAGGMGEVWKAQDTKFARRFVAIKLIRDEDSRRQDAVSRERLQREAEKESSRGGLDADEAVGLLSDALGKDGTVVELAARVEAARSGRPQLTVGDVLSLFDACVNDPDVSDSARSRAQLLKMLKAEADSVAELRHNNIVGISDVSERDGFLAMDYIEGRTLDQLIPRGRIKSRVDQLKLMEQLCDGLAAAHRLNLVHRDIKPNNLIVDDATGSLRILDFGIVRRVAAPTTVTMGMVIGTPSYMSPEQIRGQAVDPRSDIFSTGDVFYELLTGQVAFPYDHNDPNAFADVKRRIEHEPPRPIRDLNAGVEPEIVAIVDKAMAKDRGDRYQSILEMRQQITRIRQGLERQDLTIRAGSAPGQHADGTIVDPAVVQAEIRKAREANEARVAPTVRDDAHEVATERTTPRSRRWWPWAAGLAAAAAIAAAVTFWPQPPPAKPPVEPAVVPPTQVTVDVRPWARVRISRVDASTTSTPLPVQTTPFVVSLPPGHYLLDCENGGLTSRATFDLNVTPGAPIAFTQTMPGFDVEQILTRLLGSGR
jgi:serine/threonine protein kinase